MVWFRRDLRCHDHAALHHAWQSATRIYCAFIFDTDILDALPDRADRRLAFIHAALAELDAALRQRGGALIVRHGRASEEIPRLAASLQVAAVHANEDYEPAAKARDHQVAAALAASGRQLHLHQDQVIFAGNALLTANGKPYTVFTPYLRAWRKKLTNADSPPCAPYPLDDLAGKLAAPADAHLPTLDSIGFTTIDLAAAGIACGTSGARQQLAAFLPRLADYRQQRDFPALDATSQLSPHLRFGTLSIRELVRAALAHGAADPDSGAGGWLNELVWRDFYFMLLDHYPQVVEHAFQPRYDQLPWDDAPHLLAAWQQGRTGYPLVDAAMRELAASGRMHNRLRMVTASFLVKDLGISWRLGEAWFARHLLDFDLAANNGGWQWSASTGCDAQPWFRIFNPITQSEKFDPDGHYIRRHLPELTAVPERYLHAPWRMPPAVQQQCGVHIGRDYPAPVVDHAAARLRTLARFGGEPLPPLTAAAAPTSGDLF